jgi:hypothetical protein
MLDHVVVDVEIQKTIEETPGGWDATDKLGVAVACVWEYTRQRMRVYGPEDVGALRERLLKADRISGFNIFNFDFPVIWEVDKQTWIKEASFTLKQQLRPKTDDMLRRIWQALGLNPDRFDKTTHGGWGLDAVAGPTLSSRKIGYGGDAPKWYQQELIQKVANYCADDVAIERDLTDFVDKFGYVLNDLSGGKKRLEVPPWSPGK